MTTEQQQQQSSQQQPDQSANVPSTTSRQELQAIAATVLGDNATRVLHNFDGDKLHKWELTALASSGECGGVRDLPEGKIQIKYFYAHPVTIEKEGGELIDATRIVLFTPYEEPFAFVSMGIAKGLGQIIDIFGIGPYVPPINARITETKTPKGHIYNIVPVRG